MHIAVAVTVAVITVTVAEAARTVDARCCGIKRSVEDYRHVPVSVVIIEALYLVEHVALEQTGADDEERNIDISVYYLCVSHNFSRRTVDDDIIIFISQLLDH